MAIRLSTGLRNAMLDQKAVATNLITSATVSFESGSGTDGRDRIVDAVSDLSVYRRRDNLTVAGAGQAGNNGTFEILAVAAGYVEVAASSLTVEATGSQVLLAGSKGGAFVDLFRNCVIDVYSGSQPASADDSESGSKLLTVTLASGSFTAGVPANGINFGEVLAGFLSKESGETWSGLGLVDGTAGWFRTYDNAYVPGASDTEIRFDGSVATSGAQFNMSLTAITAGATTTVNSVSLTLPAS